MGKKITFEDFKKRADEIHKGKNYTYHPETFIDTQHYISAECPIHGTFRVKVCKHLSGHGCGKCNGKNLSNEERESKCREKHGQKFIYDWSTFINTHTPMRIICPIHNEFWMDLHNHLSSNYGCRKCGNLIKGLNKKLTQEQIIERFKSIHQDDYDYSDVEYIDYITPVKIKCNKCGNSFLQKPSDHIDGCGCPICNNSRMENTISKLLIKYKVNFNSKKQFDWLIFKQKQHLDFYLTDYNVAIECQGEQHFVEFRFKNRNNKDKLLLIKQRDENKKRLCKEHNVPLYYINYNEDIEIKLKEILIKEKIPFTV